MIGTIPVYSLAPLEYRLALDAASVWLARSAPLLLRCDQPALQFECLQRLSPGHSPPWRGVLWLEPGHLTWVTVLVDLTAQLQPGARLAVLLSLTPTRQLLEPCTWSGDLLGWRPGGLALLRQALKEQGFIVNTAQAFHGGQSLLWSAVSRLAHLLRRRAQADRLEFTARLCYIQPLERSWGSTCTLILAHRP